jgi:hypothetical protein
MKAIQTTVLGTANSQAFHMDVFQNPFAVSVACVLNAGAATWNVQHCFDLATTLTPLWNGSTGVTWFTNSGIAVATGAISGNYAFPVAAIRLNVIEATATASVTIFIDQATNAP